MRPAALHRAQDHAAKWAAWIAVVANGWAIVAELWRPAVFGTPPLWTLVLAGAKDPLCDPECPVKLSRRFSAPLAIHPEAGHDLSLDAPEWLAAQVRCWIDQPQ